VSGTPGTSAAVAPELLARVKQVHLRTHRLVNTALAGSYRSTFRGQGVEFEDVRPYIPGDDVRSIDWNVTARTGEPFIKTFREERELAVHILVDSALPMDFGTRRWTKREAAAQFAGLLALVALHHQDRIGVTLFGEDIQRHVPAGKGRHHALRMIREVLCAPASKGRSDLAGVLAFSGRVLRRRSLVLLVSDFLSVEVEGEWTEELARLARRHDLIAVRPVDPFEERLPNVGLLSLRGITGEGELEIDTRARAVREAWQSAAEARKQAIHGALRRAQVDRFDLPVDRDLAAPLVEFFRRRAMSRGPAA
jgi:uncharacterized protein (DUF58 family)